jgi:Preprotein translocase subunit SecY
VNSSAVNAIQQNFGGNSILGLLNLFSGGGLGRIALFALGIMPYITASIILQLLTVVVPSLEKLSKEGEVGQARITQYTRYLTVGLAFAQSIGYVFLFKSFQTQAGVTLISNFTLPKVFLIVISLTAGTVLLMWMGELITQRGIGNGISLLIFADRGPYPARRAVVVEQPRPGVPRDHAVHRDRRGRAIVFVQEGQRRIPIQYAKRVIGRG